MKRTGKIVKFSIDTIRGAKDRFMIESVLFKVYNCMKMSIG